MGIICSLPSAWPHLLDLARRWSSPDTLAERAHVGANAGGVHTVVTQTLSTGRAHVNAASGFADNPDDDIIGEAEPTALLARLDAACIYTEATMVQPGIDFATSRASLNALVTGNVVMTDTRSG